MKGAKEYANLFKTAQYGRLYIVSGFHARGKTFQIWVLPEGLSEASGRSYPLCSDAVEVYGVIGGNPGWSEQYGWLHKGKWQQDFKLLCEEKKKEQAEHQKSNKAKAQEAAEEEQKRVQELLNHY